MTEPRYSISLDELVASARVSLAEQVEVQPEKLRPDADGPDGPHPYGDGISGDADGG